MQKTFSLSMVVKETPFHGHMQLSQKILYRNNAKPACPFPFPRNRVNHSQDLLSIVSEPDKKRAINDVSLAPGPSVSSCLAPVFVVQGCGLLSVADARCLCPAGVLGGAATAAEPEAVAATTTEAAKTLTALLALAALLTLLTLLSSLALTLAALLALLALLALALLAGVASSLSGGSGGASSSSSTTGATGASSVTTITTANGKLLAIVLSTAPVYCK